MDSQRMALTDDTEDVSLTFGEEDEFARQKIVKHPVAVVFHLVFRVLAILSYLLCGWFSDSFIVNFVVVVIFLSMDFWTVKNITGRLLVGLRWWNYVDEDGKSHWVFEARKAPTEGTKGAARNQITNTESRIFWLALVVVLVFWAIFFFGTIFTLNFKWFMVTCVGIALNGANLYGYIRCKIGAKKKLSSVASNFLGQQVLKSMVSPSGGSTSGQS